MATLLEVGIPASIACLTGFVAWQSLRHRYVRGAEAFGVVMVAVTAWAGIVAMQRHPLFWDPAVFAFLVRLIWIPTGVVAVGWLAFGLTYTGRKQYLSRRRIALLGVGPAITAAVALCHGSILYAMEDAVGSGPVLEFLWLVEGVWPQVQALGTAYQYGLIGVGSLLVLETLFERPFPHPGQLLILLMIVPPWILNVLQVTMLHWKTLDPTILGFGVTGLAGLTAIGRFQLLDAPLSRGHLLDEIDGGVLVYGPRGTVYDFNEPAADMLGSDHDVRGTNISTVLIDSDLDISVPEDIRPFASTDSQRLDRGDVETESDSSSTEQGSATVSDGGTRTLATFMDDRTVTVEDSDGQRYVELRTTDLSGVAGQTVSRTLMLLDVTERERQQRELKRKNEFLDEFASVVSHDIDTPLGVIENEAQLLEMTDDVDEHVAGIHEATDQIRNQIDALRNLARQGRNVGQSSPVDLERAARDAWDATDTANGTLEIKEGRVVDANRELFGQLLENLFSNAVEHGRKGTPAGDDPNSSGSTNARVEDQPTGPVVENYPDVNVRTGTCAGGFYVADNGPGIPAADRGRVFEQGFTTTENGSGMGLAIVRRIAEGHDWDITVTDSLGGGARFEFRVGK